MLVEELTEAGIGYQKTGLQDLRWVVVERLTDIRVRGQKFVKGDDIRAKQRAMRAVCDVAVKQKMALDPESGDDLRLLLEHDVDFGIALPKFRFFEMAGILAEDFLDLWIGGVQEPVEICQGLLDRLVR